MKNEFPIIERANNKCEFSTGKTHSIASEDENQCKKKYDCIIWQKTDLIVKYFFAFIFKLFREDSVTCLKEREREECVY